MCRRARKAASEKHYFLGTRYTSDGKIEFDRAVGGESAIKGTFDLPTANFTLKHDIWHNFLLCRITCLCAMA